MYASYLIFSSSVFIYLTFSFVFETFSTTSTGRCVARPGKGDTSKRAGHGGGLFPSWKVVRKNATHLNQQCDIRNASKMAQEKF